MRSTQEITSTDDTNRARAYGYFLKGLTCREIGKLLDLSPRTVERYSQLDKWQQQANPQPLSERAQALKKQGFSYAQIAQTLRIGKSTVYGYLRQKSEIRDKL